MTDVLYDDSKIEQIISIKPTALHRKVDNAIFEADEQGKCTHSSYVSWVNQALLIGHCRVYIYCQVLFTTAKVPLVDAGI